MDELLDLIQLFMQQIEQVIDELSDEEYEQINEFLMDVMEFVAQQISNDNDIVGGITSVPPLEPGPFPSSNVNSFKYDPENQNLFVKFMGKDTADSGPIYKYDGVPGFIYDVFSRGAVAPKTSGKNKYHTWVKGVTPSLGASLYALIRNGGYPYQKIQ
jgi:KTSC domain